MNIKRYNLTMLIVALLAACAPTTNSSAPSQNGMPTKPIATSVFSQQTLGIPTPTISGNTTINGQCFDTTDKPPLGETSYEIAVFENTKAEEDGLAVKSSFLLNMETRKKVNEEEVNEGFIDAFVSPDGTMLSAKYRKLKKEDNHIETLSNDLIIMTADGTIQKNIALGRRLDRQCCLVR